MKVLKKPTLVRDSVRPMCADTPLHTLSESLSELSLHICLSDLVERGVGVRVVSVPAPQHQVRKVPGEYIPILSEPTENGRYLYFRP